jgi:ADP-dependent NAD(P)H-hydrate dehydratase / NAD(P)H-hydrate epimerase
VATQEFGIRYGSKVVVLAGPGNNGGDGYVVASVLARRGAAVSVVPFGAPRSEPARQHAFAAASLSGIVPDEVDLVVDAVFGVGARPGVPAAVTAWRDRGHPVLALDLPSGVDADTGEADSGALAADVTVAFHSLKPGHLLGDGPDRCGRVRVVDIGLVGGSPSYLLAEASDAPRPARRRRAHKWAAGSVLVLGGEAGMVGAAVMAAKAALRFGAGAVGLATPDPTTAQILAPEILAHDIGDPPSRYDVWVVGPGLGPGYPDLVAHAHRRSGPTVIDADALRPGVLEGGHPDIVLTPHDGELLRIGPGSTESTLLRKGNPTIIDGDVPWIVATGGPELATIGTGDVLAGMIGALLARGLPGPVAARSAAFWHGTAAASRLARTGFVTADTLLDEVGRFAWGDS